VAQQSGAWAAKNILAEIAGETRTAFHYHDKGIMAMIGRNAAVAAIGKKRHELDGAIGFAAWIGVHALLMSGVRERVEAFVDWGWNYFSRSRAIQILDRTDVSHIDWGEETESEDLPSTNVQSAP
jgi:NADH dehydrogenase